MAGNVNHLSLCRWKSLKVVGFTCSVLHYEILWNHKQIPSRTGVNMWLERDYQLGTPTPSKTDGFSEKFQTAFDPPPLIFGKLCCNFFLKFMTEVSSIMAKIWNINFWIENDPPPWNFSENSSVLEGVGVPKGGISQSQWYSDTPQLIGWGEDYLLE